MAGICFSPAASGRWWTHPVATASYAIVVAIGSPPLLQQQRAINSMNIILAVIGASIFIRSLAWLIGFVLVVAGGWAFLAAQFPASAGFGDFGYGMFIACVGSVAVSVVLRHTTHRPETARAKLRRAADLDPVTELYNRRGFWTVPGRLRELVDRVQGDTGRGYELEISTGFVTYDPSHPCSLDELPHRADIAMYAQKHSRHGQRGSAGQLTPSAPHD
ncbi:MAG TPA: hypothetical protein VGP31_19440 [Planosporangium sp.]|jgi:hypothetical protein|nr:hypothetical protein [Planosporangium sp.]